MAKNFLLNFISALRTRFSSKPATDRQTAEALLLSLQRDLHWSSSDLRAEVFRITGVDVAIPAPLDLAALTDQQLEQVTGRMWMEFEK